MRGYRVVMWIGGACLLSGCAGLRARQELDALQARVGRLDQRISQLERGEETEELASGAGAMGVVPSDALVVETGAPVSFEPVMPAIASTPTPAVSSKPATRDVQQALKNAGLYQGEIDGKKGPMTREAIKEFQRLNELSVDGVVGKRTWAKLKSYLDLTSTGEDQSATPILK